MCSIIYKIIVSVNPFELSQCYFKKFFNKVTVIFISIVYPIFRLYSIKILRGGNLSSNILNKINTFSNDVFNMRIKTFKRIMKLACL